VVEVVVGCRKAGRRVDIGEHIAVVAVAVALGRMLLDKFADTAAGTVTLAAVVADRIAGRFADTVAGTACTVGKLAVLAGLAD